MTTVQLAAFTPTPEAAAWRARCQAKTLTYGLCRACGQAHYHPRSHCPHCHAEGTELAVATGSGVVYSWTTVQAKPASYVLAYVELAEGVTLLTQLDGVPQGGWQVGTRVQVAWAEGPGGQWQPVFRAADDSTENP